MATRRRGVSLKAVALASHERALKRKREVRCFSLHLTRKMRAPDIANDAQKHGLPTANMEGMNEKPPEAKSEKKADADAMPKNDAGHAKTPAERFLEHLRECKTCGQALCKEGVALMVEALNR